MGEWLLAAGPDLYKLRGFIDCWLVVIRFVGDGLDIVFVDGGT